MDSFRGSRPPTFISFFLDNQTTEGDAIPTEPQVNLPIVAGDQNVEVHEQRLILSPPRSLETEPDITAYAESVVSESRRPDCPHFKMKLPRSWMLS